MYHCRKGQWQNTGTSPPIQGTLHLPNDRPSCRRAVAPGSLPAWDLWNAMHARMPPIDHHLQSSHLLGYTAPSTSHCHVTRTPLKVRAQPETCPVSFLSLLSFSSLSRQAGTCRRCTTLHDVDHGHDNAPPSLPVPRHDSRRVACSGWTDRPPSDSRQIGDMGRVSRLFDFDGAVRSRWIDGLCSWWFGIVVVVIAVAMVAMVVVGGGACIGRYGVENGLIMVLAPVSSSPCNGKSVQEPVEVVIGSLCRVVL
ncbi:hypothetical protein MRB53_039438 [Persea americana]|nr:hypothetical protein MRB53_039438 [Persea americana]